MVFVEDAQRLYGSRKTVRDKGAMSGWLPWAKEGSGFPSPEGAKRGPEGPDNQRSAGSPCLAQPPGRSGRSFPPPSCVVEMAPRKGTYAKVRQLCLADWAEQE